MGKNANFVSHKKSKLKNQDGSPQLPSASALVEGEIAINFGKDVETLSIKNESGDVVTFSSDNYYSEKKLGSAFTGANSAVTVTDVIEENEEIIAAALTDLDERKLDTSAYTPTEELWVSGTGLNSVVLKGSSGTASGNFAVAEGRQTSATSTNAHAEGSWTVANGTDAHAEGQSTSATSYQAHAEGWQTLASGGYSHAEGERTLASAYDSHAEGERTSATSEASHSEGRRTKAIGMISHAEGDQTEANGYYSHTEGSNTKTYGYNSHAEGDHTSASGMSSHAEGSGSKASGHSSHAEGYETYANGQYSHSEGRTTSANGQSSHAEGDSTLASGSSSHAEGYNAKASGSNSHAEGYNTTAIGDNSHAEGDYTVANGNASHAEGQTTSATSFYAHAEGQSTLAANFCSHAEGNSTIAIGYSSHAEGQDTITNNQSEHASGKYNVSHSATTTFGDSGNTLFSVGNGTSEYVDGQLVTTRHNAFEIRQNGDIYITSGSSDIKLQDYLGGGGGSITVDQVLDNTTSASTNPVSSKAVYDAVTDNELVWTNAYVTLSGAISSHTEDTSIHLTSTEKGQLHTHSNKSALDAITGNVGTMAYENTSSYSSATEVSTALGNKINTSTYTAYTASTATEIGNKLSTSDFNTYSGAVDTTISSKASQSDLNTLSGNVTGHTANTDIHLSSTQKENLDSLTTNIAAISGITTINVSNWDDAATNSHTHTNKTYLDGITGTIGTMAYQNANSYSSATEVDTALGNKVNTSDIDQVIDSGTSASTNAVATKAVYNIIGELEASIAPVIGTILNHTGNTSIHVSMEDRTNWNAKLDEDDVISAITPSNSGSTAPIATKVVAENEQIVSAALTDLDARKLDASAYTPTDLSNYYTKSETSGATELANALNNKADSAITFTAGTGLSGGGDLSANRTISLAMPTTYSAETYTSTTITSSEPVVYALVRYTGTTALANQVCPVDNLADGQQCNVIYQSANNNAYDAVISTDYVEPDGQAITLNVPASGYAEINYINIKGIIFVRGI